MKLKQDIPLNILLADDDRDDRFFFETALQEISIATQLETVPDGEKLMTYLSKNLKCLPDLLFLDINMPRKNGMECLKEIRASKQLSSLPVIMYSTALQDEVARDLYENGAHYYLHKCALTELPEAIESVIKLILQNDTRPSWDEFIVPTQKHTYNYSL